MAPAHAALLRGINVGGKNKLPMAELREVFADLGCEGVRTYIQSGNVAFRAPAARARTLARDVQRELERRFALAVPVVLRTHAELERVAAAHPLAEGVPETALHVFFLADKPAAAAARALDPDRSPGDRFVVSGKEVYACCPNGIARTKLTNAWFDGALGTVSTGRNWRTVRKLVELVGAV